MTAGTCALLQISPHGGLRCLMRPVGVTCGRAGRGAHRAIPKQLPIVDIDSAGRGTRDASRDRLQLDRQRPLAQIGSLKGPLLQSEAIMIGDVLREDDPIAAWHAETSRWRTTTTSGPVRAWNGRAAVQAGQESGS